MKHLFALLLVLALASCATHAPVVQDSDQATYDASTPPQYPAFSSGYLGFVDQGNKHLVMITANRAANEPAAVPYVDEFGNHVFLLDASIIATEYDRKKDATTARLEKAK